MLEASGALLSGHFLLTSGRHSAQYIQCAQVLKHPRYAEALGRALAASYADHGIDLVVGPALGGVIIAHEVARALDTPCLFAERDANGRMALRRGFTVERGQRVLVVEDVITTGGSVREVIDLVRDAGGEAEGVGVIVDRSGGRVDFGVPLTALLTTSIATFTPEGCPLCAAGGVPVKPGSRKVSM
ncbi:MAG: orotate phosphoribosyltransferase [Thermoanaerobacterales bacterium]|nr:orotate phosphoribosyltransferase [Thermoanaerobacterales bacterium]